jgi:hypothetical protein
MNKSIYMEKKLVTELNVISSVAKEEKQLDTFSIYFRIPAHGSIIIIISHIIYTFLV